MGTSVERVKSLADEAYGSFETATRADDTSYVRIKEDSPEWITELVHHAHGEMFPDDWRYAAIVSALECISEADDPEDAAGEWADGEIDVYTGARLAWLASDVSRASYCDDVAGEIDLGQEGIIGLIGWGQYQEASEVYGLVLGFLQDIEDES